MRFLWPLLLVALAPPAYAQSYQCRPTAECMLYPEPCTESAYKDEVLKIDFSEDFVTVEFEIYGSAEIPLLAKDEQADSTSFLMSVDEISIFATLYHSGELAIMLPSSVGAGYPSLLQLTCENVL